MVTPAFVRRSSRRTLGVARLEGLFGVQVRQMYAPGGVARLFKRARLRCRRVELSQGILPKPRLGRFLSGPARGHSGFDVGSGCYALPMLLHQGCLGLDAHVQLSLIHI